MIKNKIFDCVEMKADIQSKILKEKGSRSSAEFYKKEQARISIDPILGAYIKKVNHLKVV
jgi:hypothetical protein